MRNSDVPSTVMTSSYRIRQWRSSANPTPFHLSIYKWAHSSHTHFCLDVFTIDCRRFPRVRDVLIFVNGRGGEDMRLYTHKFKAYKRINDWEKREDFSVEVIGIAKMIDFSCASLFIFYESMPKRDKTGIVVIIELYTGFDTMDSSPKLYKSRTRIIGFVFQITERE